MFRLFFLDAFDLLDKAKNAFLENPTSARIILRCDKSFLTNIDDEEADFAQFVASIYDEFQRIDDFLKGHENSPLYLQLREITDGFKNRFAEFKNAVYESEIHLFFCFLRRGNDDFLFLPFHRENLTGEELQPRRVDGFLKACSPKLLAVFYRVRKLVSYNLLYLVRLLMVIVHPALAAHSCAFCSTSRSLLSLREPRPLLSYPSGC